MQRISPFLWFDDQAEEVANFYVSVFKNSKIKEMTHYTGGGTFGAEGLGDDGVVRAGWTGVRGFERRAALQVHRSGLVRGQLRDAGGDRLLLGKALVQRREEVQCDWLADKYGLSWQVVPTKWAEWGKDAAGMQRLMHALMQMKKIDIATLERAYDQK
jgi:predicted 3-demethylubiquinone-9 3-methyltransferase (glyoxalase superfamily)